jgi:uncharacterized protein YndB with AHSA1/START domain
MEKGTSKTRTQEHEVEIAAPIEAVWKALTDAEELTRWFVDRAEVTPGVGGSYWIAWGEGENEQGGSKMIEIWEPPHRLRLVPGPPQGDASAAGENQAVAAPLVDEYTLEARGNRTVLRLVFSGVPDTPEWDGFYDSTNHGWKLFFRGLRHYLERHPGKPRNTIIAMQQPISFAAADAWQRFIGPEGLAAEGSIEGLTEGSRFQVTTSAGERLTGEIAVIRPPKTVMLLIDNFDGAVLSAAFEQMGGANYLYLTLATYGSQPAGTEGLRERWTEWLRGLFADKH